MEIIWRENQSWLREMSKLQTFKMQFSYYYLHTNWHSFYAGLRYKECVCVRVGAVSSLLMQNASSLFFSH